MSSLCLLCEGYSSDGSDYYVRRRRNSTECSGCDDSICECHDSCDCSDWESGSERGGQAQGYSTESEGNNDIDEPSGTKGEVEGSGTKIPSKDGTKDEEPEFVKLKDFQEENKEKAKNRPQNAKPQTDSSDGSDSASDNEAATKGTQSGNSEESDKEKPNENNSESSDENGYPKEIQEFVKQNETAESSDNTGVRTRRYANYSERYSHGYRRRRPRRQNARSGSGRNYRSHRRRRSTRRRHLYSKVKMPNGELHWITTPAAEKKSWKCGTETELISLRPTGRMGKKEYQLIAEQMEGTRKNHISGAYSGYEIMKIQKVVNPCLWKRYRHRRYDVKIELHGGAVTEQMLFHGSPAIKELIQKGFDERYSSTGGMYGAGVYFAENSSKSNQYAWGMNKGCPAHNNKNCMICERQLLLCRVTLGKIKEYTSAQRLAHAPVGYHSVKGVPTGTASGLQYTENIVYRGEQVYPEFLITYKLKP